VSNIIEKNLQIPVIYGIFNAEKKGRLESRPPKNFFGGRVMSARRKR
jgi:hypothetical protein